MSAAAIQKEMAEDQKIRLANKRLSLDQTYRTNLANLKAQVDRHSQQDTSSNNTTTITADGDTPNPTPERIQRELVEELIGLVKRKQEVEENMVKEAVEMQGELERMLGEFGAVLEGRERDLVGVMKELAEVDYSEGDGVEEEIEGMEEGEEGEEDGSVDDGREEVEVEGVREDDEGEEPENEVV